MHLLASWVSEFLSAFISLNSEEFPLAILVAQVCLVTDYFILCKKVFILFYFLKAICVSFLNM